MKKKKKKRPERKTSVGPQPLKDLPERVARLQKLTLPPLQRIPTEPTGLGSVGQFHSSKCILFHLLQFVVGGEGGKPRQLVLHETERCYTFKKKKKTTVGSRERMKEAGKCLGHFSW